MIIYQVFSCSIERRIPIDRLRRASIASSNSDLANSISPPAVRFTVDTAVTAANPFNISPATRKKVSPGSSKMFQHSVSNSSVTQQQNLKLNTDTSSLKSRTNQIDIDGKSCLLLYDKVNLCFS